MADRESVGRLIARCEKFGIKGAWLGFPVVRAGEIEVVKIEVKQDMRGSMDYLMNEMLLHVEKCRMPGVAAEIVLLHGRAIQFLIECENDYD